MPALLEHGARRAPTPLRLAGLPGLPGLRARGTGWTVPASWPLSLAVAGFPIWWALGLTAFTFPVAAVAMGVQLYRRRQPVRVPPGFALWAAFLVLVVVSATAMNLTAPGTLPPSGTGRYIAFGFRLLNYLAITVVLLWVGNVGPQVLPKLRAVRSMALLGLWTVLLGTLALVAPRAGWPTPAGRLLPPALADAVTSGSITSVELAQVQPVLGYAVARPAAPYAFTNAWGYNLSLLLVWFVVGWLVVGRGARRWVGAAVLAAAIVPIVYSLNRGVWIGIGLSVLYVAVRLAARGRMLALAGVTVVLGLAAMLVVATPLKDLITERAQHGHSNEARQSLASDAVRAATSSPLVGYGTTRVTEGSDASIAIGKTEECPKCGNRNIGSTGQIWLVMIAQGFLGVALYLGYFLWTLWAFRRDHSVLGIAGGLVVLLTMFYGFFYTGLTMPLALAFVSIGLLWRNAQDRDDRARAAERLRRTVWAPMPRPRPAEEPV